MEISQSEAIENFLKQKLRMSAIWVDGRLVGVPPPKKTDPIWYWSIFLLFMAISSFKAGTNKE